MIALPDLLRERAARIAESAPGYGGQDSEDLARVDLTVAGLVERDLAWAVLAAADRLRPGDARAFGAAD